MVFEIHPTCKIHPSAIINVKEGFIGKDSIIRANATIEGNIIKIGREAFIDNNAKIGGGSCFDSSAFLMAGDWLHMGVNSQVNIARGVKIGSEVGIGIDTKVFTHGAYLDCYNLGAPVQWAPVNIGDNVWLPNAWVNPGVNIGSNVVVAARSFINSNIPSGALVSGSPAKIIKESCFPKKYSKVKKEKLIKELISQSFERIRITDLRVEITFNIDQEAVFLNENGLKTIFKLKDKKISGAGSASSIIVKDQLRRNGIRFRYEIHKKDWVPWKDDLFPKSII